jgi:hypothetical protein
MNKADPSADTNPPGGDAAMVRDTNTGVFMRILSARWRNAWGIIAAVCVLAAAGVAAALTPADVLAGRWTGETYRMAALSPGCKNGRCTLTLDIVRCPSGWCGIEVSEAGGCGGTTLKLIEGTEGATGGVQLEGSLALAEGTEPYVVRAYVSAADEQEPVTLHITGDTGGEFRIYRRSFPFEAMLTRISEAVCTLEKPVS